MTQFDERVSRLLAWQRFFTAMQSQVDVLDAETKRGVLQVSIPGQFSRGIPLQVDRGALLLSHPGLMGSSNDLAEEVADFAVELYETLAFKASESSTLSLDRVSGVIVATCERPTGEAPFLAETSHLAHQAAERRAIPSETFYIDGERASSLQGFFDAVGIAVNYRPGSFGTNLDSFSSYVGGGMSAEPGWLPQFVWAHSTTSRRYLGYTETLRVLSEQYRCSSPENRRQLRERLLAAEWRSGPTVFDWLVDIFAEQGVPVLLQ